MPGENFFTGDVYDIVGEWQMHNLAFLFVAPAKTVVGAFGKSKISTSLNQISEQSKILNLKSSLQAEDRDFVRKPSVALKWLNKICTFNVLNWGD